MPPLRERKDDIKLLLNYFIDYYTENLGKQIKKIDPAISRELVNYSFPGNIRELRNMIERAIILSENGVLKLSDFQIGKVNIPGSSSGDSTMEQIWDIEIAEQRLIKQALERTNNNKSKAAELLNISWQSLDRRLKKFDLN